MAQSFDFNEVVEHFKKVVTTQYFCFDGRMNKRDFWMFFIPGFILGIIPFIGWIIGLALLLPMLGATARRLHDIGKTGWLNILWIICPPIGPIVLIVLCIKDGDAGSNAYGEGPAVITEDAK